MVHTSNKDDATIAVAGVIHQDTHPQLGEVPDLEGYHQKEGVPNVKLGENLSEDQGPMLKDLTRKNPDVFTDMPEETDVIQHRVKLTEVDPEPMTMAEDLFCRLSGKKYPSKIDLTKGYWQIPVAPEDVYKTAFVTPDGQYEFLRMPFGMVNSGATLVRG